MNKDIIFATNVKINIPHCYLSYQSEIGGWHTTSAYSGPYIASVVRIVRAIGNTNVSLSSEFYFRIMIDGIYYYLLKASQRNLVIANCRNETVSI